MLSSYSGCSIHRTLLLNEELRRSRAKGCSCRIDSRATHADARKVYTSLCMRGQRHPRSVVSTCSLITTEHGMVAVMSPDVRCEGSALLCDPSDMRHQQSHRSTTPNPPAERYVASLLLVNYMNEYSASILNPTPFSESGERRTPPTEAKDGSTARWRY